mmetsp:Transcript_33378/g.55212  ORF Transcript_33378/g.55212 Transcript_33378/m.55212 type:complete len:96 (-) Transcript_33378:48-335(-)
MSLCMHTPSPQGYSTTTNERSRHAHLRKSCRYTHASMYICSQSMFGAAETWAKCGGVIGPSHGCHDLPVYVGFHIAFGTATGWHPSGRMSGTAVA